MGSPALRQIVLHLIVLPENRGHQKAVSQHILHIQVARRRVPVKLHYHGPHGRNTCLMGLNRHPVQIRHQSQLKPCKTAAYFQGLVIEKPWHTVALGAVKPAVGGQKPELHPQAKKTGISN